MTNGILYGLAKMAQALGLATFGSGAGLGYVSFSMR